MKGKRTIGEVVRGKVAVTKRWSEYSEGSSGRMIR